MNTVVKNLHLEAEDVVLVNSHTYGAVTFSVDSAIKRAGADMLSIDITMPVRSEEQIVEQVIVRMNVCLVTCLQTYLSYLTIATGMSSWL